MRSALNPARRDLPRMSRSIPPGFGVIADRGAYTGSPLLMLLGGKDETLPVAKIENYLAYAQAAGHR